MTTTLTLFLYFSSLFPDVVNCMQTDNLELKKLVYLYLMNYAKSQPDMAIMAVNTFVKVRLGKSFFTYCICSIMYVCISALPLCSVTEKLNLLVCYF